MAAAFKDTYKDNEVVDMLVQKIRAERIDNAYIGLKEKLELAYGPEKAKKLWIKAIELEGSKKIGDQLNEYVFSPIAKGVKGTGNFVKKNVVDPSLDVVSYTANTVGSIAKSGVQAIGGAAKRVFSSSNGY